MAVPTRAETARAAAAPASTQRKRSRRPPAARYVRRMVQIMLPSIPSRRKIRKLPAKWAPSLLADTGHHHLGSTITTSKDVLSHERSRVSDRESLPRDDLLHRRRGRAGQSRPPGRVAWRQSAHSRGDPAAYGP